MIEQHLRHLQEMGTGEVAHRNGTLLKHLQGTWRLLEEWDAPESVRLAGLYHSVYSTGGFEQQLIPLHDRDRIAGIIGKEAERMVYLFGACDRPITHPRIGADKPMLFKDRFTKEDYPLKKREWCALCEIMLANEMDLGRYDRAFYKKHLPHYQDLFSRFEPWLSQKAITARLEFERTLTGTESPE